MLGSTVRNAFILVAVLLVAVLMLREHTDLLSPPGKKTRTAATSSTENRDGSVSHQMIIPAGRSGHFYVDATIGYQTVTFVVDTGASAVALTRADAETLGLYPDYLEYDGRAQTANGIARFARVTLDEITIGEIVVRDVPAVVMDAPMGQSLLGMTFLRKLDGFSVESDRLILRW